MKEIDYEKMVEEMTPEELKKWAEIGLRMGTLMFKELLRRFSENGKISC